MASRQNEAVRHNRFAVAVMRAIFVPGIHALWRPRIVGRENMPSEGPCFLYGNHSMYLDPFVANIFFGMDVSAGVMAREFMRKGLKAWFMRNIGIVPVARNDASVVRAILKMIAAGRKITIYPEGGRRWDGRPQPWIRSTVKLYQRTGLPVYPVITHGSYVAWPRWATYPRPARLRLQFLPPVTVDPSVSVAEAEELLRTPIDIDEAVVPDEIKPRWAFRPAKGIEILLYRDPTTGNSGEVFTPDGYSVRNREGSLSYKMLPDSTLRDEKSGQIVTTGDLYARIRALPLPREADGSIVTNHVEVHISRSFPTFEPLGVHHAHLKSDAVVIDGIESRVWPLEHVRSAQIERNWKLQIATTKGILQLGFRHGGSALQWLDYLADLGIARL